MNPNIATDITKQMNETIEFCSNVSQYNIYSTYRPMNGVIAHRNNALCRVMNYQAHQPLI